MRMSPNTISDVSHAKHLPAANTDAVVTIAAAAGERWVLDRIDWSYDGTPTGRLTIAFGGTTILDIDIIAGGPGNLEFLGGLNNETKNEACVITLAAGGLGVTGKLFVHYR